jgi:hypothetical protein
MRLLVYFDGQFWTGLIESNESGDYFVRQHIFGAEPSDVEILDFVNIQLPRLLQTAPAMQAEKAPFAEPRRINPKRLKKMAAHELRQSPLSTKSQEAMRLQLEQGKEERRQISKAEKEERRERNRKIAQEKARQKHRGR